VGVCVCVCVYVYVCDSVGVGVWLCVCVYMHQYAEVALTAEGSVPNTTSGAGGTAFTSAARFSIVERARVRVGRCRLENVCGRDDCAETAVG
jgi:hypothetical protein